MSTLELRPLSTGEILDRTFTLYRRHFLFFIGLAAIPRLPGLGISLAQIQWPADDAGIVATIAWTFVLYLLILIGYLYSQGATVYAVSEIYLGRSTTIAGSLRQVTNHLWTLFVVAVLTAMSLFVAMLLLIIPFFFLVCRLMVCVPPVIIENKGAVDSYSRSLELTRDYATRAFLILLLYFVMSFGFSALASLPLIVGIVQDGVQNLPKHTGLLAIQTVLSTALEVLLTPVLLIATSVYYYDLRVRKEGFDIQFLMQSSPAPVSEGQ